MKRFVQSLTNEFLAEAKSSPRMFEDLAAMEHYMAESYEGRAFVEILQNADDANASSLSAFSCGNDFVIANNGRPFDQKDLIAICRSGASSKKRGSGIGYRGIGFKSATSISTEIIIYSSGVFFTFSKLRCAKEMNRSVESVPTVRIPFIIDECKIDENLKLLIRKYEQGGYNTFFIFKDGNRDKLLAELSDISPGWLLFLNHVESVSVNIAHLSKNLEIKRKSVNTNQHLFTDKQNCQSWLVITGDNNTAIAFKFDKHIVPCNSTEALFHCYLPTLDSLGYPFKANADFSTDPSRKHIIINDDETKRSIESIANLIVKLISDSSFENQPYLVDLLTTRLGISEASSFLDRKIISQLKTARWIPLQDGTQVSVTEYKTIPEWFDGSSRKTIMRTVHNLDNYEIKKEVFDTARNLNDLLLRCGCQPFGATEFATILSNIDAVSNLNDDFLGKLWGYTLRSVYYSPKSIESLLLKDRAKRISILSNIQRPVDLSEDFCSGIKGVLNSEELLQISKIPAFGEIITNRDEKNKKQLPKTNQYVQRNIEYSKWKTPIQNCMVSEQLHGRSPKDVSKRAFGYDIISTEKNGDVRYFSVKVVESLGAPFVLNEKEYDFAEQYSSNYCVYVIERNNPENNMIIEDILSIQFEKRVKEWEWISGKYEVKKSVPKEEAFAIDSRFIKDFSLHYLNKIQVTFLRTLCDGGEIADFESEFSCKATSISMQVNSIVDFYIGDILIEKDLTIKKKYLGALKYMFDQE